MKVRAILNPRAGLAAQRALSAVQQSAHWGSAEVKVTTGPGDARRFAEEAAATGYDLVLALGGDGTANEVAWGLLGSRTVLGLVPVGSGNGLARTLGIPLRPDRALTSLETAVPRAMDVGTVNGRPFLNVAGAGFDAAVGHVFHEHGKRGGRRGVFTYIRFGVPMALSYRAEPFTLVAGDRRFEGPALLLAFVNGRQYGGGAIMAPGARLDDGLLDIVVIGDAPRISIFWNALRLFRGTIHRFRHYQHVAASSAVLTGRAPVLHHRDGEPEQAESDRLEIGLTPRALAILVPRGVSDDPKGPFTGPPLPSLG